MTTTRPTTITRVLVANRGEIARRVFATCRRLGIGTVAVHSDADAGLPHVAEADQAVRLPGSTPAETYLRADLLVEAARRSGADAIHPGYGFGSESADFARAVIDAGLTWIGPAPESIEAMGSKIGAKELMRAAGVPVLEAPAELTEADLPLIVKASAGGGGRGMRIVRTLDHLQREIAAAEAEAASAFGDGTVFVEPYVERGRHVEVQVVGHAEGVLVLGERDCSVQRRHQKVVEEAPAPNLPSQVRTAMHEAARAAAAAVDYRGAGTVEFLYDPAAERFFFLEMNTRLQVEHPVTEAVLGLDLVALQIEVAEGRVPDVVEAAPSGHAIEVRLYAEDPAADHQPQSGPISRLDVDHDVEFGPLTAPGVRLDAGYAAGSEVSTFYDAMLAKVIAWAPTREQAARALAGTLERARLHGPVTNREQLVAVLRDPAFLAGDVSTAFLAERDTQSPVPGSSEQQAEAFLAAAVAVTEHAAAQRPVQRGIPTGWRNVEAGTRLTTLSFRGTEVPVRWRRGRAGVELVDDEVADVVCRHVEHVPGGARVTIERAGLSTAYDVALVEAAGVVTRVDVDGPHGHLPLEVVPRFTDPAAAVASGSLLAPMPGTVLSVDAEAGAALAAGDRVLVMEAMKMQHVVTAPTAGTLTEINVHPGQQVAAGDVLAVVTEQEQA
ncbi:biotin carboxylase N-terminal domain-containing protein [Alteromonas gracilis]